MAETALLVADTKKKSWRLVFEFGTAFERWKLSVIVDTSEVMRCSRSGEVSGIIF